MNWVSSSLLSLWWLVTLRINELNVFEFRKSAAAAALEKFSEFGS